MASYKEAIAWMALNDDTEWAENGDPQSVTAALVADIFGKDDEKVRTDLCKMLKKMRAAKPSLRDEHRNTTR
jgi:hypothetical protein